jgi:hypothetical protein
MLALDTAFKAALESLALETAIYNATPQLVAIKYASPKRDTPVPFVSHFSTDSRPSELVGGFGAQEGRDYEHSILVTHRSGTKAEGLKERIEAGLLYAGSRGAGLRLAVEGWEESEPLVWVGDIHDLGDLLVDGTIVPYAGFRVRVSLQRPLAR